MPKHPIPWTENHRVQKTCAKIMHKTIGGSAQPNIGSKTKIFWGATPDPIKWGYGYATNPLLTMWKEYNTTQQKFQTEEKYLNAYNLDLFFVDMMLPFPQTDLE